MTEGGGLTRQELVTLLPFIRVHPCSLHFVTAQCTPLLMGTTLRRNLQGSFCTSQAILRATGTCHSQLHRKRGFESFYSIFFLLGSSSPPFSCSSPSHRRLTSIPFFLFSFFFSFFTPLLSSLFSERTSSPCQVP